MIEPYLIPADPTVHKRSNTLPINGLNEVPTPTTVIDDDSPHTDE